MSGNALWKTNEAAIGVAARHRSWRLGLRRLKILYPKLSLNIMDLLEVAGNNLDQHQPSQFLQKLAHDLNLTWSDRIDQDKITDQYIWWVLTNTQSNM